MLVVIVVMYTFNMPNQQIKKAVRSLVNTTELGVSFSIKSCRDYDIDWQAALKDTINLGFKRLD